MATVPVNHGPNSAEVVGKKIKLTPWKVGGCFDRFPCEILHSIALMLPFSSIKQLRRSSKFWYNILTDPNFVNLHLACALEKPPGCLFTPHYQKGRRRRLNCYFVEPSEAHPITSKIFEYSGLCWSFRRMCISSGGLVCVYSSDSNCFRVFNPDIQEEVQVSDVPKVKNWSHLTSWFFGYSPSTKEYKILEIGILNDSSSSLTVGAITTLGSNIWRDIQNVPPNMFHPCATECQGNLFWIHGSNVVSFDLVSEKFLEIPSPPQDLSVIILDRANVMSETLVSMSHTIGYVRNNRLWVLEDKIKGIWKKRYDFSVPQSSYIINYRLTGILENGALFGHKEYSMEVFSHVMGCTRFRFMEIELEKERRGRASPRGVQYIAPHVRSLVSPVRIMEDGRKSNRKRKWVLDRLKLDEDATEVDIFDSMYQVLNASDA